MYTRLSAAVRLVACFAALHIVYFVDPARQHLFWTPLAALSVLFSAYTAWLYWRTVRDKTAQEGQTLYWIDTLWYLAITFVTTGFGGQFFFFLSFPLLFVSLRWGFTAGIKMALFSSAALLGINILRSTGAVLLTADILLPPIGLLALGYLLATWAYSDRVMNRRLASLEEFNALFNPRFSIDQMLDRVVRHLALTYSVDKFALILAEDDRPPRVFRANLPEPMYQVSEAAAAEIASAVSGLNDKGTIIYRSQRGLQPEEVYCSEQNSLTQKKRIAGVGAIANRFDCSSFGSVQFNLRRGGRARLFVCSNTQTFASADLPFFHQLGEQLTPRIENVQLLDRLAGEAAEAERQKISRDIHDSAIQPYIGLKFALEALARKVPSADPLAKEIGRLVEVANTEIIELRSYVRGLRGDEDLGRAALVPALRRQAARFGELYGITVVVESPESLRIGDELANEAFHIVSEGLSNIRRHTASDSARIRLSCDAQLFTLKIINSCDGGTPAKLFTPRSIAERADALGGRCHVDALSGGATTVTVEIPLRDPTQ